MKHKHYDVLVAWLADQTLGLEFLNPITNEWINDAHSLRSPLTHPNFEWRIKPKMVRVGRHEWPAPLSDTPKKGTDYFVSRNTSAFGIPAHIWQNSEKDNIWLKDGCIHLTEEAAQQHADALVCINRGDV